jgi:hypothetical protein
MPAITCLFRSFKKLLQILTFGIDPCQSGYNQIEKYSPPPPAQVNRSLQDKTYAQKLPIYATQNYYAVSLSDAVYAHQPRFLRFAEEGGLPFQALASFGRSEHAQRLDLVEKLVKAVWSPTRLGGVGQ